MSRYIDTDKLNYQYLPIPAIGDQFITKSAIDNMPGEDVAEVKHGKWDVLSRGLTLINAEGTFPLSYQLRQCSECEYVTVAARTETHKWCPHCGAKMDEGSEE